MKGKTSKKGNGEPNPDFSKIGDPIMNRAQKKITIKRCTRPPMFKKKKKEEKRAMG